MKENEKFGLTEKLIFKAIVGSQSSGCSTPESDIDIKGVYMQSIDDLVSFGYKPQIDISKDETYWEVQRFLELLQSANPSVLELLNSPKDCILYTSPQFNLILKNRDKFLTKKCLFSFGGYVKSQLSKAGGLNKKMNYEKDRIERKGPLDFCYMIENGKSFPALQWLDENNAKQELCGLASLDHVKNGYSLYYNYSVLENPESENFKGLLLENSNQLRLSPIPKYLSPIGILFFNVEHYSKHCRDYKEYTEWLKNRNTARYVDVKEHAQKIDGKNLLHCRRLLDIAFEIATKKELIVRRPNADYLISIRKGKVPLQDIIDQAKIDLDNLNELYNISGLPETCDFEFVRALLLEIRKM